ncbi:dihydrolipoyl dehydrogenase [bacterium]|jgi:dihydrolipoamide dehydrogenase|nr:dihydrolipoyl dehydrogenase [bacterium]MBT3795374.1 dihydrolipoyl dehydrogenase [bacterium]
MIDLSLYMYDYDITIIGGGPGGYVAAIEASRKGLKTALIEKDSLGGTCLNNGCIPSKSLLKSAEIADLLNNKAKKRGFTFDNLSCDYELIVNNSKKNTKRLKSGLTSLLSTKNIDIFYGLASFNTPNEVSIKEAGKEIKISSEKIIISTGSKPFFPKNLIPNGKRIVDSDFVLDSKSLPKSICIIGGGYIGIEFAYLYSSFGVKVSIVESSDSILGFVDKEIVDELRKNYLKRGIKIYESTKAKIIKETSTEIRVSLIDSEDELEIDFDLILVSTGRVPNTESLNLKDSGVVVDDFGFIKVDKNFKTNIENIYAIGDVIGGSMLAHKASEEGSQVVDCIVNANFISSEHIIPACIYCQPEISYVGISEEMAKEMKISYKVSKYPFKANGKSLADDNVSGFCKLISDKNDDILGAHIIGKGCSEMISEITLVMQNKLSLESVVNTVHPHPTLSEIFLEATLSIKGKGRNS